jgi:hypothetical protein
LKVSNKPPVARIATATTVAQFFERAEVLGFLQIPATMLDARRKARSQTNALGRV